MITMNHWTGVQYNVFITFPNTNLNSCGKLSQTNIQCLRFNSILYHYYKTTGATQKRNVMYLYNLSLLLKYTKYMAQGAVGLALCKDTRGHNMI